MAQKVNVVLVDDIDGSDATETITFGLDGATYEIDLNQSNAAALRDTMGHYIGLARKVTASGSGRRSSGRRSGRRSTSSGNGVERHSAREIRDWARSSGHKVPDRGRIPAEVRRAFDAAN